MRMILARLKKALAEQNWFAVGLELAIVVLGVVIGFQVTLWGQDKADRIKGEAYVTQLVSDLRETEELILDSNAKASSSERSAGMLVKQFDSRNIAPSDSVYTWLGNALVVEGPLPILSTAQALVSTGDLDLIADSEIRAGINAYLQKTGVWIEFQKQGTSIVLERLGALMEVIDLRKGTARTTLDFPARWKEALNPVLFDATIPAAVEEVGSNLPDDMSLIFTDRKAYSLLSELAFRQADLGGVRNEMLKDTRELLELIEAKSS